ncbi:hypothetical protein DFH07DRAFT_732316 [Mycena maculata]|uniref:Uncharacterized protein n=1 Tax=Mycena maculata TaxID=230809 RepID=A0AAD7NUK1_9AGAR|nr:hypothetical protein DFH07DRAFT_732316 [Mycena maculata]
MDALREFSHRTHTENKAPAYDSTLSPTLDAFQHLTHFSYGEKVGALLEKAWAEDSTLTLKIIWNLRSIHEGKSEREAFYRAFGWLYENHPRTAIINLPLLVQPVCGKPDEEKSLAHGYWKDLLNILALATVDELSNIAQPATFLHKFVGHRPKRKRQTDSALDIDWKPVVKARRTAIGVANHARLERKLTDPKFRALYIAVARLFSERLLADILLLQAGDKAENTEARKVLLRDISLAPKWAPSLLGAHDRHTNIATAISRLLHHRRDALPELRFPSALKDHPSLDGAEATGIMRSFYRRWVLTPLRTAMRVTETFMATKRWTEISYSRVSSLCMKNNKERFFRHDPDGFQKYLISVEKGTRTISGATLLPHQIIGEMSNLSVSGGSNKYPAVEEALADISSRVLEAQWKTLVQTLRDAGTIENSVAICDVSGSMGGFYNYDPKNIEPIFPAISLSLLLAQLAKPPFNGGFITFSRTPEFVRLDPEKSVRKTVQDMNQTKWDMNTDINAVFLHLILPLAIQHKVRPEDMIKRVFVFSDMQFDAATLSRAEDVWETNYDVIARAFGKAGYEVPQIVYWNLSRYGTVEVLAERSGVAMMSGFSPAMLKIFMGDVVPIPEDPVPEEGDDAVLVEAKPQAQMEFDPLSVMKKALSKECYASLVVVD